MKNFEKYERQYFMPPCMGRALYCLKRLTDNMLPGLRQYLHSHILRNHMEDEEF